LDKTILDEILTVTLKFSRKRECNKTSDNKRTRGVPPR